MIFSISDTGDVGEEFVDSLGFDVHIVQDFDVAPGTPAERCERLYHLCTAFAKLVPEAATCTEYSDVVDKLNKTFEACAKAHRKMKKDAARDDFGVEKKLTFHESVVMGKYGEMDDARKKVNNMGDKILLRVLIDADDEAKRVLVVILGGTLASLLKTGEEDQNVDIPDEESHPQGSSFKATIEVLPTREEGNGIVYTATIMADINVMASMLLAKFCEAQNWPKQLDVNHFLTSPILNETTLQVVGDDGDGDVDLNTAVYTQCRYAPVAIQC